MHYIEKIPMDENVDPGADLPSVLDPRQEIRIEAVHRGFLYQHLYAVATLLHVPADQFTSLAIERDEDLELRRDGETIYVQVKSRQQPLQYNDIEGALAMFKALAAAHANGEREGAARFAIVSNADPSPGLLANFASDTWPADVELLSPQRPPAFGLPVPAATVNAALEECAALADQVPFAGLAPSTLVLKLAAIVQYYASGAPGHVLEAQALAPMLEQIVAQLHDFPDPPQPYLVQRDEPPILTDQRVRLITGFSGAGKTSWASETARHRPEPIAYFDVAGLPSASIATNLARELVARFIGAANDAAKLPGGIGIELLRAADALLGDAGTQALVVLDNVHALTAGEFRQIVEAAPRTRFVALAQPWADRALIEAQLGISAEQLEGYDPDSIAAVFAGADVDIELDDANAIHSFTGGLPLYVANAAHVTAGEFDKNVHAFIAAIREQTNLVDTAQVLILERGFAALSAEAQDAAAYLSLSDVPLSQDEALSFLTYLGSAPQRAAALRELRRASMLLTAPTGVKLHDALRPLASARAVGFTEDRTSAALETLHLILLRSLQKTRNIPRLSFLVRLLPRIGQIEALVDLATSEMFYEQGNHAVVFDTIAAAAAAAVAAETGTPADRFWAMDALAYWQSRDGGTPDQALVDRMAALVEANAEAFDDRERLNLLFKQLVIAGTAHDRQAIERLSAVGRRLTNGKPLESRLFRYNRALALYRMGAWSAVRSTIEPLIDEMFKALGFPERRLLGANGPALIELLEKVPEYDDIKRTADMLFLWAATVAKTGHASGLRRIYASKLFASVGAGRSAANCAQDAADEFLDFMGDAEGARQALEEHALPLIAEYGLTDLELRARSQYAVVLAYGGEFDAADREMDKLRNYGGDPERVAEYAGQVALVHAIRAGAVTLERRRPPGAGIHLVLKPNLIGRRASPDQPCPCGSGRKYKRCHGKRRA